MGQIDMIGVSSAFFGRGIPYIGISACYIQRLPHQHGSLVLIFLEVGTDGGDQLIYSDWLQDPLAKAFREENDSRARMLVATRAARENKRAIMIPKGCELQWIEAALDFLDIEIRKL